MGTDGGELTTREEERDKKKEEKTGVDVEGRRRRMRARWWKVGRERMRKVRKVETERRGRGFNGGKKREMPYTEAWR